MKRVLMHSKGQSSFDTLTAINKNRVSSALARLYVHGLEASPLSQIRWLNEDQFELLVPRIPNDVDLVQGTRIQASVDKGTIKIHNIQNVARSISLMKKSYTREFSNYKEDFEVIDESWFDKVIADPFVKKAFEDSRKGMSKTPCNRFMTLLSNFYKEPAEILLASKASIKHNASYAMMSDITNETATLNIFDEDYSSSSRSIIQSFLNSFKINKQTLGIVTFIDKTCPLSIAQADFVRLASNYLKGQYPLLDICIGEITIVDSDGQNINRDIFDKCHSNNRFPSYLWPRKKSPFTMVFGAVSEDIRYDFQNKFPALDDRRWFDFDLYGEIDTSFTKISVGDGARFTTNLRIATGSLFAAAGCMDATKAMIEVRDFSHYTVDAFEDVLHTLNDNTALIVVSAKINENDLTQVVNASSTAALTGLPHVMIIQSNELQASEAYVPCGYKMSKKVIINDLNNIDEIVAAVYEAYDAHPYLRGMTTLNLYSNK